MDPWVWWLVATGVLIVAEVLTTSLFFGLIAGGTAAAAVVAALNGSPAIQVARALMTDPELLLLDEPAAGLDLGGREDLVRRLGDIATDDEAPTTVLVTHHVEEIPVGFTHALLLRAGAVVAQGEVGDVLTGDLLGATFGLPLTVERRDGRWSARAR
jgi:ABC-type cobalamin/Fe3+-siderophores transport system ATPase subunit